MKVWVECYAKSGDFYLHPQEPAWGGVQGWVTETEDGEYEVCDGWLKDFGFLHLPEEGQCVEYDLSGELPEWVSIMAPPKEVKDDA